MRILKHVWYEGTAYSVLDRPREGYLYNWHVTIEMTIIHHTRFLSAGVGDYGVKI